MRPDKVLNRHRMPVWIVVLRIAAALFVTFIFLTSVKMLGEGFEMAGAGAKGLLETAKNPLVGLFCGILVTSLIQSSSVTTSALVGLVSTGELSLEIAIPMVMGANIGTTITNTLVALGHVTRPHEFRRAISCSTMHDFFNMLCVLVVLPVELTTHFLQKSAVVLSKVGSRITGIGKPSNPLKKLVDPIVNACAEFFRGHLVPHWDALAMALLAVAILFVSLFLLTRILKSLLLGKVERVMGAYLDRHGPVGLLIGAGTTAAVQSSSVTTSFFVPLAAAGVLKPRQIYPMVLGANIGTTITALMASLAGRPEGMTLAFVHLLFNITGVLIFYPIPAMRIPVALANRFGRLAVRRRILALTYIACAFYGIPVLLIFLNKFFS